MSDKREAAFADIATTPSQRRKFNRPVSIPAYNLFLF
jgi:hypothetical protein